jgi:hypothetical protein
LQFLTTSHFLFSEFKITFLVLFIPFMAV